MTTPTSHDARHPAGSSLRHLLLAAAGCSLALVGLVAGCNGGETAATPAVPIAHLEACVEQSPDQPCDRLPGYDPAYWLAAQSDQATAYLDAAELCLTALLDGAVVGRRGACTDVYDAYVVDVRAGRRDLGGRLDADQAGRAFGLAYSAVVARRTREGAGAMTGTDDNARPLFGDDSVGTR